MVAEATGSTTDENERLAARLCQSPLFVEHAVYVRRQFVHCLLQVTIRNFREYELGQKMADEVP